MSSSEEKVAARPRRKPPMRAKSSDGGLGAGAASRRAGSRPQLPPLRSKSFDYRDSGDGTNKNLMTKSNSKRLIKKGSGGESSMRGLLSTANSVKNVVVAAPEQAIKVHKMLTSKAPKMRPGQMPASALSSRNVTSVSEQHKQQRNPLARALSSDKLLSTSSHHKTRGRDQEGGREGPRMRSKSPSSNNNNNATANTRRGGRKPEGRRSLTPANSRKPTNLKNDDEKDYISIM